MYQYYKIHGVSLFKINRYSSSRMKGICLNSKSRKLIFPKRACQWQGGSHNERCTMIYYLLLTQSSSWTWNRLSVYSTDKRDSRLNFIRESWKKFLYYMQIVFRIKDFINIFSSVALCVCKKSREKIVYFYGIQCYMRSLFKESVSRKLYNLVQ